MDLAKLATDAIPARPDTPGLPVRPGMQTAMGVCGRLYPNAALMAASSASASE